MTVDPTVLPGLALLALELLALATLGYVVARVALRQSDDLMALAQGMVIGPALWGLAVNFILYLAPGRAGALVGWALLLMLGVWLARRASTSIWPGLRVVVGFTVASLAVFGIALAARQSLSIPDDENHLGLASQLQAGGYPPTFPWNPDLLAAYHHGFDLLIGLLAPPFGPDLAFTTELLGAYVWVCVVMFLAAATLKFGGWTSLLVLTPLVVGPGLWTLVGGPPHDLVRIPVPAGIPAPGLRASLTDTYWPSVQLAWWMPLEATPPDIWKPNFKFSHILAFVIIERMVDRRETGLPSRLILAGLVGFLGLVDETVAVIVVGLWLAVEIVWFLREGGLSTRPQADDSGRPRLWSRVSRADPRSIWTVAKPRLLRAGTGPGLAVVLLVVGGGAITGVLIGASSSGLSLGWIDDVWQRRPLGSFESLAGGVGLLGLGIVPAALGAAWLGRRSALVVTLAFGSVVSLLLALILQYEHGQHDIVRFDGHGRFLALTALLLALASLLRQLQPGGRIAAGTVFFLLATWPTVGGPLRTLGLGLSQGPQVANASVSQHQLDRWEFNRYVIDDLESELVADHIRRHTNVDARILSPDPNGMSITTGRPNASGLVGILHFSYFAGPEYFDANRYLTPAALRRLEIDYIHATDSWVSNLPDRAKRWLNNPAYFELIIQDGQDSLYRVLPAFQSFDPTPVPSSYEALRRTIPAGVGVYMARGLGHTIPVHLKSVLSHARILSQPVGSDLHLRMNFEVKPLSDRKPEFVAIPARLAPVALDSGPRSPVWLGDDKNGAVAVYSTDALITEHVNLDRSFTVRLSNVKAIDGKVIFTAMFVDRAPDHWTGHDWVVAAADDSPWNFPREFLTDEHTHASTQWYGGQVAPGFGTTIRTYEFDAREGRLRVHSGSDEFTDAPSSAPILEPGVWTLMARLRNDHLEAAVIPVMTITVPSAGDVTYTIYDGELISYVDACPAYLKGAPSCQPAPSDSSRPASSAGSETTRPNA